MSLRDQLLKAGLVDKKAVARANREAKEARRDDQGHRQRQKQAQREAEARAAAEREARLREKAEARRAREEAREAAERSVRVLQIVRANAVRGRGTVPFHMIGADGRTVHRLMVSEPIAFKLRCGELAVAEAPAGGGRAAELVVVSLRGAQRLAEVAPEAVRFRVVDTRGISAPEEGFLRAEWEISLRPHRWRGEAG